MSVLIEDYLPFMEEGQTDRPTDTSYMAGEEEVANLTILPDEL